MTAVELPADMIRDIVNHPGSYGDAEKALALSQLLDRLDQITTQQTRVRELCADRGGQLLTPTDILRILNTPTSKPTEGCPPDQTGQVIDER